MANNFIVPNNIEDPVVLRRFLTTLTGSIGNNVFLSGTEEAKSAAFVQLMQNSSNTVLKDFFDLVSTLNELRSNILTYVEDELETVIKQQKEDVAVVAEQFGTFYEQALAASWYGLTVKAGGAVAGLEIGSLDPDVTTPGDESSYFRVVADNFVVGRAYEDLTPSEKAYLAANNLPSFGTVYNTGTKQPIPAIAITWDGAQYKHYFNGIVNFTNVSGVPVINQTFVQSNTPTGTLYSGDTWIDSDDGNKVYTYNGSTWVLSGARTFSQTTMPTAGMKEGDIWLNTSSGVNRTYRYNGSSWVDTTVDAAAVVNTGSTTINGGKITTGTIEASKISTYNLTATNASIANGMITNAMIADAAITNAKIGTAAITNAKIQDASITTAKIQDLSVSTLKIQDEAIIVPRYAEGSGSSSGISIVYTPSISHTIYVMLNLPRGLDGYTCRFKINGSTIISDSEPNIGYPSFSRNIAYSVIAGNTYILNFTASSTDNNNSNPYYPYIQMLMLGIKK